MHWCRSMDGPHARAELPQLTLIDASLAFLVATVLSAVGVALVSGPPEDREELDRQLRWRRWR
jgi:hypothetical protein